LTVRILFFKKQLWIHPVLLLVGGAELKRESLPSMIIDLNIQRGKKRLIILLPPFLCLWDTIKK
jgi:hypothetical protein